MYIPKQFQQQEENLLIDVIENIKFGALIVFAENRFFCSHIPFIVRKSEKFILEGHVSKANELWKVCQPDNKAIIIFQGQNTYIHPGWYPTKQKSGKVVPTWNYQVVHVHGFAETEQSEGWLLQHLTDLTHDNEKDQKEPWHTNDAPGDFIDALLKGIVGIKFTVEHLKGALKMNQHHTEENRLGVIAGLSQSLKQVDREVADIMENLECSLSKNQN